MTDPESLPVPLHWIGGAPAREADVTFGVPFNPGELKDAQGVEVADGADGAALGADFWPLARWQDGSVKWLAVAGTFPPSENLQLRKTGGKRTSGKGKMSGDKSDTGVTVAEDSRGIRVNTGAVTAYIPRSGKTLIDSIVMADGTRVAESGRLVASAQGTPGMVTDGVKEYTGVTATAEVERAGARRAVVKLTGKHRGDGVAERKIIR